jgi:hypothetical protein
LGTPEFTSVLEDGQINVLAISQGCSERNISAVVLASQSTRAVRSLHAAFRLSHTTIRLAVLGMNEVGESLLQLLETQRSIVRTTFEIDLQVCAIAMDSHDTDVLCLENNDGDQSITVAAMKKACDSKASTYSPLMISCDQETTVVNSSHHNLSGQRRESRRRKILSSANEFAGRVFHYLEWSQLIAP